jgi:hypothetical protein
LGLLFRLKKMQLPRLHCRSTWMNSRVVVIVTVPEAICYERIPGQGRSTICTAESTSEMGGAACNLAAGLLGQTASAGVFIQERLPHIPAGNFTLEDAITCSSRTPRLEPDSWGTPDRDEPLKKPLENAFNLWV